MNAERVASRVRDSDPKLEPRGARSGYDVYPSNRPLREEVIERIKGGAGDEIAIISRNSYGCDVLNTADIVFIDVDFYVDVMRAAENPGFFRRWFGGKHPQARSGIDAVRARAEQWVSEHPDWSFRLYRTFGGARLVARHARLGATNPIIRDVFTALDADPLYRELCANQKSFRARLTPKPWRCGIAPPVVTWPIRTSEELSESRRWNREYALAAAKYATSSIVADIGSAVSSDVQKIVDRHDSATGATSRRPLA